MIKIFVKVPADLKWHLVNLTMHNKLILNMYYFGSAAKVMGNMIVYDRH